MIFIEYVKINLFKWITQGNLKSWIGECFFYQLKKRERKPKNLIIIKEKQNYLSEYRKNIEG